MFDRLIGRLSFFKAFYFLTLLAVLEKAAFGVPIYEETARHDNYHYGQHLVVKRAATTIADVKKIYAKFHGTLTEFTKEAPEHLKSDSPKALRSNVAAIAKILPPDDKSFTVGDVKAIKERGTLTLSVLQKYLQAVANCNYAKKDSEIWFKLHGLTFAIPMTLTQTSLKNLATDVKVVGSGVGGINTGLNSMDRNVLSQIKALLLAFRC